MLTYLHQNHFGIVLRQRIEKADFLLVSQLVPVVAQELVLSVFVTSQSLCHGGQDDYQPAALAHRGVNGIVHRCNRWIESVILFVCLFVFNKEAYRYQDKKQPLHTALKNHRRRSGRVNYWAVTPANEISIGIAVALRQLYQRTHIALTRTEKQETARKTFHSGQQIVILLLHNHWKHFWWNITASLASHRLSCIDLLICQVLPGICELRFTENIVNVK